MIFNKKKETNSVIIFLHIPKTGGFTLNSIIDKQYRGFFDIKGFFDYGWQIPLADYINSIGDIKKLEVLRGHLFFGAHNHIPQKNYNYITLLRAPVERVVSEYYFIRRWKNNRPLLQAVKKMTLHEFVTKKEYNGITSNRQTLMIAGQYDLAKAKYNLEKHFSIVGITERFDETLYVLEKKLGWKINKYKKENETKNRPSIDEIDHDTIEIIREKNQKDIELYKFANELLDNQLKQLKNSFFAEIMC
ncbi:sulfotransferase family 2 domain-containing protein [Paramaledivibacter caminithermalis]|jgi:hypothetical protein|uniref:Sulfotransferase family protein n=1 Tax=Paramaledivibacter caminithermalis (strain DSM 15212 / CIP 107654 / DViRD3) TaxID=1121301 RepID=A0A1M6JV02_PARC5|nr:sulfotransferase family 2 domain-containing protein [Paramaledivibacter caminithermalis]SHJ50521.1 Sulfotransferase family protein [Paramaledivibacter caminithermalis DSM 15212]